ncbi:GlxA family transcriptional regulator [Pseudomonas luteola]|uniref:GlxA family transcriptional regulator n=1 Tax=Pseudomonas luteola TaxID=47886 RepID=UPI00123A2CD6|nr:GlxA family transcriptional regulator [Pseudomonas luteola]QEU26720.1 GlxA family transcriptional regulator [Pseudomonas luteola]
MSTSPIYPRIPPVIMKPRLVDVLAFEDVQILDVTGPLQVFASANDLCQHNGKSPPYEVRVISATGGIAKSSAGLGLVAEPLPMFTEPCDTLIVAGGWGVNRASEDHFLVNWLRDRSNHCQRVASVCSGAFLLAAAGLLEGRRAVTHWTRCEELARIYPSVQVEANPIFINDGPIWTSAGITAGIDLALAMVESDLGHALALAVARQLVVFLKRPGGQSQYSNVLLMQSSDARLTELHDWIALHLHEDLSLERLASKVGMSERTFLRRYRALTGETPSKAVESMRVERACLLLVEGKLSIKRVAFQCGFGSEETFRRAYARRMSISPIDYRKRFGLINNGSSNGGSPLTEL